MTTIVSAEQSRKKPVWLSIGLLFAIGFVLGLSGSMASTAAGADQQAWLISTRCAPRCGDGEDAATAIRYWRLADDCTWSCADSADFQAADNAAVPTIVFLHGNQTDSEEAVMKAWYCLNEIRSQVGDRAFRFVIWSWPADRMLRRARRDAQLKTVFSDVESHYLAHWLSQIRPGVKVSLIGHSFGPRIIGGAMHLLAGGEIAGKRLPAEKTKDWTTQRRNPVRAVLLAAAIDAHGLAPGGRYGLGVALLDQILITQNGCDRALRWYPRLYGRGGHEALGAVGPCGLADENVEVVDLSCAVGKTHDWRCYCSALSDRDLWKKYTFLDEPEKSP